MKKFDKLRLYENSIPRYFMLFELESGKPFKIIIVSFNLLLAKTINFHLSTLNSSAHLLEYPLHILSKICISSLL
jgi:hypothetical protein